MLCDPGVRVGQEQLPTNLNHAVLAKDALMFKVIDSVVKLSGNQQNIRITRTLTPVAVVDV